MKYVGIALGLLLLAAGALIADYVGVFERWKKVEETDEPPMGEV